MIFSVKRVFVYAGFLILLLGAVGSCISKKSDCMNNPRISTSGIYFHLKDKTTGNDIITAGTAPSAVPDSIKLKNLVTGQNYPLMLGLSGPSETILYSQQYLRPANVEDSLVFYFGNAIPDTLVVQTGLVDGWRGDECPTVREPGITKVTLRGQVLLQTTSFDEFFTIKK